MEYDELELDTLGDEKTALFVFLSDTDSTFNFVCALMYSQLFNLLCDKADDFYGGRLPVHVRLILDEFANIGQIPNFDKLIATIRSREISAAIILQSQSQLKTIYKDAADTIVGNCDSTLFLGGKEKSTLKEISELLGKETIDLYNQSENRGSQISHPDSITDWLNKFSEANDLPHIHPHAFRHTVASILISSGIDPVTTANELGHADANTTQAIYAHQIAQARAEASGVRAGVFSVLREA